MVRAAALGRGNRATLDLVDTFDADVPTGIQLLAKNAAELLGALSKLEELGETTHPHFRNVCAIDLNLGCPSPDVIRCGAGPALLKRRAKLTEIFTTLSEWRRNRGHKLGIRAVGCKVRLGLNRVEADAKVYLPLIDAACEAGLDYVTVHARHAGQRSRDAPSWSAIGEAVQRAEGKLAVLGNGDVFSAADAVRLRQETGCDGVMLARASIRNPFVFRDFHERETTPASPNWDGGRVWPTADDVLRDEREYNAAALRVGTKPKFLSFHAANFERLSRVAATGDRSVAVTSPKTIHLS